MPVIGHGIDAVEIARISRMLQEHGENFVDRCFTEGERSYAESSGGLRAQRYAVRFACKEAVMKALGTGWTNGVAWNDIEVVRDHGGQPRLSLSGKCAELANERKIANWHVSLTHTQSLAIASVIASD